MCRTIKNTFFNIKQTTKNMTKTKKDRPKFSKNQKQAQPQPTPRKYEKKRPSDQPRGRGFVVPYHGPMRGPSAGELPLRPAEARPERAYSTQPISQKERNLEAQPTPQNAHENANRRCTSRFWPVRAPLLRKVLNKTTNVNRLPAPPRSPLPPRSAPHLPSRFVLLYL